jgi:hypothetical protein
MAAKGCPDKVSRHANFCFAASTSDHQCRPPFCSSPSIQILFETDAPPAPSACPHPTPATDATRHPDITSDPVRAGGTALPDGPASENEPAAAAAAAAAAADAAAAAGCDADALLRAGAFDEGLTCLQGQWWLIAAAAPAGLSRSRSASATSAASAAAAAAAAGALWVRMGMAMHMLGRPEARSLLARSLPSSFLAFLAPLLALSLRNSLAPSLAPTPFLSRSLPLSDHLPPALHSYLPLRPSPPPLLPSPPPTPLFPPYSLAPSSDPFSLVGDYLGRPGALAHHAHARRAAHARRRVTRSVVSAGL